ncbi:MAG: PAS domain-containing protein [Eubacteriales bacterium]
MDVNTKFGYFLENLGNPFMVGSLVTEKTFYINKQATELFGITTDDCDLGKVFDKSPERIQSLMVKSLKENKPTLVYNYTAITKENKKILVDLQVGYFNDEKTEVFLEIIPQNDTRMAMALHQIQHSTRAEAILNFDDDLTILECNEAFYKVFESNEDTCQAIYCKQLSQAFHVDSRTKLVEEIQENLQNSQLYTKELTVENAKGEEHWYCLELQKRELDNSGAKLMCSLVNIEKQVEAKEKFDMVNQYLSAVQETTVDLLYRVDIATNTMYSYHEFQSITDNDRVIPDYVNTFFSLDTIHPDDKEIYLKGFRDFHENDIVCEEPIRFSLGGSPYQWYKITGKKIFDKEGNLTEVFGTLVNVDNEVNMQEEVSSLNQYFEALQSISGESFYRVDVKNKILTQKGQVAEELGFFEVVQNFPESVLHKVYPEDLELYKTFTYNSLKGIAGETRVRVLTAQGGFQWYEILCQIIRDETGAVSEVVGKMNNIHKEMTMQDTVSTLHKYFDVLNEISGESLYIYDIKTDNLRLGSLMEKELGLPTEVGNFPESVMKWVHPDDVELFKIFDREALESGKNSLEVRLKNLDGQYQWYELLSDIIFDDDGNQSEVFGRIKNIQSKHKLETEVEEANNYLLVMQELSDDILYRIDVEAQTLVYTTKSKSGEIITNTFENYPQSTFDKNLMHPEDEQIILEQTDQWLSGNMQQYKLRMKLVTEEYEWYLDSAINIRDKEGNVTEIYGRLQNIHNETMMKKEVVEANQELSVMNQYFTAMQTLSGESLYTINVETKVLCIEGDVAHELGMKPVHTDYPACVIERIHPEDAEKYKNFSSKSWSGLDNSVKLRARNTDGSYQWYRLTTRIIRDNTGKAIEILGIIRNIHATETMEAEVSTLNQYVEAVESLSGESLYYVDMKTRILRQKGEVAVELGVPDEIPNYPEGAYPVIHPEHLDNFKTFAEDTLNGKPSSVQCKVMTATGEYQWYEMISKHIYDKTGDLMEIFGRMTNIESDMNFKSDFSQLNQYFSAMQDLSGDVLFHIDIESMTFHHNDKKVSNFGMPYDITDFVNTFIDKNIIHPDCHVSYRKDIDDMLSGRKMEYHVLSLTEPDVYEWYHVQGRFIQNEQGKPVEIFGKMKNVQEQRNLEERAYHDMMTGALNKATFEEQGKIILDTASLEEKYALIFIDLDDFKGVNDTLGHSYGDALLSTVGKRLKRLVRGDDLVGRIGGDEFAVMLRNVDSEESVLVRTNIMLEALQKDFSFEKQVIGIKASVGVSVFPQHGTTYKDLIGKADLAVYESKRRGKNVVSMYAEELEEY